MTPDVDALVASARTIGWTMLSPGRDTPVGVALVRRVLDRVDVLSYMTTTGLATVTAQQIGGPELWRYEVPVRTALWWATGEFADDSQLSAALSRPAISSATSGRPS